MEENKQQTYSQMGLTAYQNQPTWKAKQPSANSIDKLKRNLNKQVAEIKKMVSETIQSQPDRGKGIGELASLYKSQPQTVLTELDAIKHAVIPKDTQSSLAGVKYEEKQALERRVYLAENQLFQAKTGFLPSAENLQAIGKAVGLYNDGVWVEGFNNTRMRELVLLDDWPSWLKSGLQLASKVIPGAVSLVAPKFSSLATVASDAVAGLMKDNTTYEPRPKQTVSIGLVDEKNTSMKAKAMTSNVYLPTLVDLPTIATTLCPEYHKEVARFDDAYPAAVYTTYNTVQVTPTPSGTFFCIVNCGSDAVSSVAGYSFIRYTNNSSTYDPITGTYTSSFGIPNPIASQGLNIASQRLVGLNVTFEPSVVANTNLAVGQVDFYHDPSLIVNGSSFNSPSTYLSLTNIGYRPFYQKGPIVQSYSQTYYNTLDDNNFYVQSTANDVVTSAVVYIGNGLTTTANTVGVLRVQAVWNVIPTAAGLSSLAMRAPGIGPYTADFIDTIFTLCPQVFMDSLDSRLALIQKCKTTNSTYAELLDVFLSHNFSRKNSPWGFSNLGIQNEQKEEESVMSLD